LETSKAALLEDLNKGQYSKFKMPVDPSPRLTFFIKYPARCFKMVRDDGGVAVRRLIPPVGIEILLVTVHLPSKLYASENDQVLNSVRVARVIQEAEAKVRHSRTIVVGDFNMDPFEHGVVGAEGLHAVMDRRIALRGDRVVQEKSYKFFYNPMWGRMGDQSKGPPGTYYFNSSSPVNFFWHTFDQVLIRPELLKFFPDTQPEVLDKVGDLSLLSANGIPNNSFGSDHLPLLFEVEIEKGI
jgi:hypothetical protein